MERTTRGDPSETIKKYSEDAKRKQAEARKMYEEQERMQH
jgi:hypothetical protein